MSSNILIGIAEVAYRAAVKSKLRLHMISRGEDRIARTYCANVDFVRDFVTAILSLLVMVFIKPQKRETLQRPTRLFRQEDNWMVLSYGKQELVNGTFDFIAKAPTLNKT